MGTEGPEGSPSSRTLRVPLGLITETAPEFGVAPVSAASRVPPGPVIIFDGFDRPLANSVAVACAMIEPDVRPKNMPNITKLLSVSFIPAKYIMRRNKSHIESMRYCIRTNGSSVCPPRAGL